MLCSAGRGLGPLLVSPKKLWRQGREPMTLAYLIDGPVCLIAIVALALAVGVAIVIFKTTKNPK